MKNLKQAIGAVLIFAMTLLPCQRASAPIGPGLGLALKCVAIGVILPTALIIYKCDRDFYLVRYQLDESEAPWWASSKANVGTNQKLGGRRCEGPWPSPDEPSFRAWVNNKEPAFPVFPCGPLGSIPPANTSAPAFIRLQQSANGISSWSPIATTSTAVDPNDNFSFVVFLNNSGTNGMTADQLREVADCDMAVTNSGAATSRFFRFQLLEVTGTNAPSVIYNGPAKRLRVALQD